MNQAYHNEKTDKSLKEILSNNELSKLFKNVNNEVEVLHIEKVNLIGTITKKTTRNNCYAVSPYSLIINYSKEELVKLNSKRQSVLIGLALAPISLLLRIVNIDKIYQLNNYIFSTNFFDSRWESLDIRGITAEALEKKPDYALGIRSVNKRHNPKLYGSLIDSGWIPVATRQVYLFKGMNMQRRCIKNDMLLLESSKYSFVDVSPDDLEAFRAAESLYNKLYLDKYTYENIQYTSSFLQQLVKNEIMHLAMIVDQISKEYVGVVGIIGSDLTITAPIVGYDTSRDQKEGLYRMCLIYIIKYAAEIGIDLNLSSGAPTFKRNRGGEPEIEYMFVYVKKLTVLPRLTWWLLSKISLYIYKPILEKQKL